MFALLSNSFYHEPTKMTMYRWLVLPFCERTVNEMLTAKKHEKNLKKLLTNKNTRVILLKLSRKQEHKSRAASV